MHGSSRADRRASWDAHGVREGDVWAVGTRDAKTTCWSAGKSSRSRRRRAFVPGIADRLVQGEQLDVLRGDFLRIWACEDGHRLAATRRDMRGVKVRARVGLRDVVQMLEGLHDAVAPVCSD